MSRAIIDKVLGTNSYTLKVSGYDQGFPGQCVTLDELSVGDYAEVVDIDNKPPHKAAQFGSLRVLPASGGGEYLYTPLEEWLPSDDIAFTSKPATLAKAFFFGSEKNPRWQVECPLYRRGTVTKIIDEKYMTVSVWSYPLASGTINVGIKCRTDYMTCDTAAFTIGDEVVIKFEDSCIEKPVVVGFWGEPKGCGLTFILTGGDGTSLTDAFQIRIRFYDSSNSLKKTFYPWTEGLTISNNEWTIDPSYLSDSGSDPNGYWVDFRESTAGYYLETQYPLRYKSADQRDPEDLIQLSGSYSVELPYLDIDTSDYAFNALGSAPGYPYAGESGTWGSNLYLVGVGGSVERTINVKSSIPYRVARNTAHKLSATHWWTNNAIPFCSTFVSNYTAWCANNIRYAILPKYNIAGGGMNENGGINYYYAYPPDCYGTAAVEANVIEYVEKLPNLSGEDHKITVTHNADAEVQYPCGDPPAFYTGHFGQVVILDYDKFTPWFANINIEYDY